jgi:SAM-dependent methyltransferase
MVEAGETGTGLPRQSCDAVVLRGVYHHFQNPAAMNASLRDTLRAGGRLAVVDFAPTWFLSTFFPVKGVPSDRGGHGIPPSIVVNELEAAGFSLESRIEPWQGGTYCLMFRKRADVF